MLARIACVWIALLATTICMASTSLAADPAADELRGAWKAVYAKGEGVEIPLEKFGSLVFTFDGAGELTSKNDDLTETFKYMLTPTASPKQLDVVLSEKYIAKSIYKLDGDSLTICMPHRDVANEAARPKAFDAPVDSGYELFKFERVKK